MKRGSKCAIVLFCAAALLHPARADDRPADFRGMVKVISRPSSQLLAVPDHRLNESARLTRRYAWYAAGICSDLPHPEFINRFHLLLMPENPGLLKVDKDRYLDSVRVAATSKGTMTIDMPDWGFIEFFPSEASIRALFIDAAPAFEERSQYVTVRTDSDGRIEILIDEPKTSN